MMPGIAVDAVKPTADRNRKFAGIFYSRLSGGKHE